LTGLAGKLPEGLLAKALDAALSCQFEHYRAMALTGLAEKLPEALPLALDAALSIQDERYRAEALTALMPKFENLSNSVLLNFWQETVKCFCRQTRQQSLRDIAVITPLIFQLGSQAAIQEVVTAIELVTRWWP
jgi:hypothetical protein